MIRTSAAAALAGLRQVITVLLDDSPATDGPPARFGQVADLMNELRSAGMTLHAHRNRHYQLPARRSPSSAHSAPVVSVRPAAARSLLHRDRSARRPRSYRLANLPLVAEWINDSPNPPTVLVANR